LNHPSHPSASPILSPTDRDRRAGTDPYAAARALVEQTRELPPHPRAGYDRDGLPYVDPRTAAAPPVVVERPAVAAPAHPDPKNYEWVWDPSQPLPPVASSATLAVLVEARGQSALDEAVGAVRAIDLLLVRAEALDDARRREHGKPGSIADRLISVLPGFGRTRPEPSSVTRDLGARRGIYADRCRTLAKLLKVEMPVLIDPRYPSSATARAELGRVDAAICEEAGVAGDADRYGRRGVVAESVPEIDEAIIGLVTRREGLAPRQGRAWESTAPRAMVERTRTVFGQDELVASLEGYARCRRQLADQVLALEAAERARAIAAAELVKATAARVESAVKAAGGAEALTSAIVAVLALAEPPRPADPELAVIETNLVALAAAGVSSGPSIVSARSRRAELTAAAEASAARRASARRARAGSLLSAASAGQASAVAEIVALAVASPHAFPAGFVESIT
jgi:hypothetical protein